MYVGFTPPLLKVAETPWHPLTKKIFESYVSTAKMYELVSKSIIKLQVENFVFEINFTVHSFGLAKCFY